MTNRIRRCVYFGSDSDGAFCEQGKDIIASTDPNIDMLGEFLRNIHQRGGADIDFVKLSDLYRQSGYPAVLETILTESRDADYIFFDASLKPLVLHSRTFRQVKRQNRNVQIVLLSPDEIIYFPIVTSIIANHADLVVAHDSVRAAHWLGNKFGNGAYAHFACSEIFRPKVTPTIDVSYRGKLKANRQAQLDGLRDKGIDIHFPDRLTDDEYCALIHDSKISLVYTLRHDGVTHQLVGRIAQVVCAGRFALVEDSNELRTFFTPGKDIVAFTDIEDCGRKITAILENKLDKADSILKAGDKITRPFCSNEVAKLFSKGLTGAEIRIELLERLPKSLNFDDAPRTKIGRYCNIRLGFLRYFLKRGKLHAALAEMIDLAVVALRSVTNFR